MKDASRGYGLFLHAFGLRNDEMRDQFCADIKAKVISLKLCHQLARLIVHGHVFYTLKQKYWL